ncbi:hypothetical protein [Micromonospora sp. NPDC047074]|uniref:hypothetical protein n=1 Tax=Micromonospora sp. NPDC047074 TaxID=3154339 RepID=UPI0033E5E1DC
MKLDGMTSVTKVLPRTGSHRWRFGGGTRKLILLVHIVSVGVWVGLDVAMAVLIFTAMGTDDPHVRGFTLQALGLVTVWPMLTAGLLSLATGVLLGLGSRYGLVRYWWVLTKLVLTVALCTLIAVALRGGAAEAAAAGRVMATGVSVAWNSGDMLFPPIVSSTALLVAFALSVFKPWGRLRRGRSRGGRS